MTVAELRVREFDWLSEPDEHGAEVHVYISRMPDGWWEIDVEDDGTLTVHRDDDAVSAWSTVAYYMCENGATPDETTDMVNAAPDSLGWCFDGQVGMYAYDINEEQDG